MMEICKFSISILYLTGCRLLKAWEREIEKEIEWEKESEKRERIVAGLKIPKSVGGRLFSGLCAFFNYIRTTNARTNTQTDAHTHTDRRTHTQTDAHTHRQTHTHTHVD